MADTDADPACPECRGQVRIRAIETVCENCGLVVTTDAIDRGPEWRSFDETDIDRRRTGAPLTRSRHDRGLSTEIGFASTTHLPAHKRRQLARLRREHSRSKIGSKADRNQVYGFTEIRRIVGQLALPLTIRDQACALFDSAQQADLLRGRSLEGFAAATVYAACRTGSIARTIDEISATARADKAELKAAYKALNSELGLATGPTPPVEYLPRYASQLGLGTDVENQAREYATVLFESGLIGGRNPSGVAAACLYTAANEHPHCESITQTAAAEVGDVSAVTIRSTVREINALNQ